MEFIGRHLFPSFYIEQDCEDMKMKASKLLLQKNYEQAGEMYINLFNYLSKYKSSENYETKEALKNSILCYKKISNLDTVEKLCKKLIDLYEGQNKKQAEIYESLGDLFQEQNDNSNANKIIENYEQALLHYDLSNTYEIKRCTNKLIELCIKISDYRKVIFYSEQLLDTNHSFRYEKTIFTIVLCHLALDEIIKAKIVLDNSSYYIINSQRYKFLESIINSIENINEELFTSSCKFYNFLITDDLVKTLLEIKHNYFIQQENKEIDLT